MIKFTCKDYENIVMFDDIALQLIHRMGHSGTVPGAIKAMDINQALSTLQARLLQEKRESLTVEADDKIGLNQRAFPLINMLIKASENQADILWDYY